MRVGGEESLSGLFGLCNGLFQKGRKSSCSTEALKRFARNCVPVFCPTRLHTEAANRVFVKARYFNLQHRRSITQRLPAEWHFRDKSACMGTGVLDFWQLKHKLDR